MAISIIKFLLLAYLAAFCQNILANLTAIGGVSPNFGTIIIVLIVLKSDFQVAFPAALLTGLVIDILNPELFGLGTAIRFAIAAAVWELKCKMDLKRLAARVYLLMGAEAAFQLFYQCCANRFDLDILGHLFVEVSLPILLYTSVLGTVAIMIGDLSVKIQIKKAGGG